MFDDVIAARLLREQLLTKSPTTGLREFYAQGSLTCPVKTCQRPLHAHHDHLPCQRRHEFDRFGFQH